MIGANICRLRRELGLTQAELAAQIVEIAEADGRSLTLTKTAVTHWERGRTEPALRYRRFLVTALETDSRLLFPDVPRGWGEAVA